MSRPFSLMREEKERALLRAMDALTRHHLDRCAPYAALFRRLKLPEPPYRTLEEVPYLPVGLFKSHDLLSIPKEDVFKTLLSSGTSSAIPSRIYLDKETAQGQSEALRAILTDFIGSERRPMLIVDTEAVIKERALFSARGAALVGMLPFGYDPFYLLDPNLAVREEAFKEWRARHADEPWLIFGFTAMVWNHFVESFSKGELALPHSLLLHGGGWKKMEALGITQRDFKERLLARFGIASCHSFYGMVEQTGSIYMECEQGVLHASDFSELIVRDPETFHAAERGESGVVQTLSVLPRSYPGHSLLTEDLGVELGVDDCPCGRRGKTFQILGRVPQAEPRGCSDVGGA